MNIYTKIQRARGGCIVGTKKATVDSVESAAELFGLSSETDIYEMIERAEAVEVLKRVLHKDMAYSVSIMSSEQAKMLAREFIGSFGKDSTFYTNGEYGRHPVNPTVGPSWSPATDATFDSGVVVIFDEMVGCAWFTDED